MELLRVLALLGVGDNQPLGLLRLKLQQLLLACNLLWQAKCRAFRTKMFHLTKQVSGLWVRDNVGLRVCLFQIMMERSVVSRSQ